MQRLRSLVRRIVTRRWLYLLARLHLGLGRRDRAQVLLRQVVMLAPSSFAAHRLLARILLDRGCRREALQELGVCHRLDPARLQRVALSEVVRRQVLDEASHLVEREVFDLPPPEAGPLPGEWDDLFAAGDDGPFDPAPAGTDFVDQAEFRRFRELAAIAPEEIRGLDIDHLIAQLTQESQPGGAKDS